MYARNQVENNNRRVRSTTQLNSLNRADQLIFALLLGGVPDYRL
jgi:hypothetical protein